MTVLLLQLPEQTRSQRDRLLTHGGEAIAAFIELHRDRQLISSTPDDGVPARIDRLYGGTDI